MKLTRATGILVFIIGVIMYFAANYIMNQVNEGKMKISSAEKQVNQASGLFSLNPYAKQVGQHVTGAAQEKINEGKQQVQHYEGVAATLHTGGIVAMVAGVVIFLFSFAGSSKKKTRR